MSFLFKYAILHFLVVSIACYFTILPNDTAATEQKVFEDNNDDSNSVEEKAKLYEKEITLFTTEYQIVCLLDTRVCEKVATIKAYRGNEVLYVRKVIEPAGLITDHLVDYKIAVKR